MRSTPLTTGRFRRRGNVMIYTIVVLPVLFAVTSLAVDLGRVQLVKSELQRAADVTARGYMSLRVNHDDSIAQYYGPVIPQYNSVDMGAPAPTVTIERGSWDSTTKTFIPGGVTPFAVRVRASRTKAANNAVKLPWAMLLGLPEADVRAEAVAMLTSEATDSGRVSAQADIWLAGMPAGSTASVNDKAPFQSPKPLYIPVVPGSYISFTSLTGKVRHGPLLDDYGPDGSTAIYSHNADAPTPQPADENGIADVKMPINAFMGVFLDDNRPDTTAAPEARDYSTSGSRSQETYDDIKRKQPFFIGDGKTGNGGGAVQKFRVPDGATRLFVGIMDGHEWSNNVGYFDVTVKAHQTISIVR